MLAAVPRAHQQENHMIDADSYWRKVGAITWADVGRLADAPATLWMNGFSTNAGSKTVFPWRTYRSFKTRST
jgi:hypothetical protein